MTYRYILGLLPFALLVGTPSRDSDASRWGEFGHRLIAELAVDATPADMPPFFRAAKAQLVYLNPEPDRWRDRAESSSDPALDGGPASDHYINLERLPPARRAGILAAPTRVAYTDSLRTLGAEPAATGTLPFRIVELTQLLRSDFRRWRATTDPQIRSWIEQRIINDAGILGHYVADAANPAHTTIHHNGWVGDNPSGFATDARFHSRFESQFVQARITAADVRPLSQAPPQSFASVRAPVLAYIQQSHAELERLYALDKKAPFNETNDSAENKRFAAERLGAAATMLRDVWWSAWVTSKDAPGS
ncbi:MAG: hypothetical protein ABJF01_24135 [bacterium]